LKSAATARILMQTSIMKDRFARDGLFQAGGWPRAKEQAGRG